MPSREEQLEVKQLLEFTWGPFFSRFGSFTEVQVKAIPPILEGRSVLVSARTASGKTEAVAAPLTERIRAESWHGLSVLYVSPTRALVNDLYRRLETPADASGVMLARRTGDHPSVDLANPPQMLITTPESFDSMMTRRPAAFLHVRAVVVDEIHLLDNTARGDQVRVLLSRLRALRKLAHERGDAPDSVLQIVLLSATVSDPEGVAARYADGSFVIRVEGARSIDATIESASSPAEVIARVTHAISPEARKILVFCRKRNDADMYAAQLRRVLSLEGTVSRLSGEAIFAHHGKLDRKFRLDVEQRFNESEAAICFATSTLELGIDIGDIDLVAFIGAPYSIGSFLQCIGRGNRRTHRTLALCLARDGLDAAIFEVLTAASRSGTLDERHYAFRPAVVVQQLLSYLRQVRSGEISLDRIREVMRLPDDSGCVLSDEQLTALVVHLIETDVLRYTRGGRLALGEAGSGLCEMGGGAFSNFSSGGFNEETMFDEQGRPIGQIQGGQLEVGDTVAFGGRMKSVVKTTKGRIDVTGEPRHEPTKDLPSGPGGRQLPFDLAQLLLKRAGYFGHEFQTVERSRKWIVLHGLGTMYGSLLLMWLRWKYDVKGSSDGLFLFLRSVPPVKILEPSEADLESLVRGAASKLARRIDPGKYAEHLPDSLLADFVVEALDLPRFVGAVYGRAFVPADGPGPLLN